MLVDTNSSHVCRNVGIGFSDAHTRSHSAGLVWSRDLKVDQPFGRPQIVAASVGLGAWNRKGYSVFCRLSRRAQIGQSMRLFLTCSWSNERLHWVCRLYAASGTFPPLPIASPFGRRYTSCIIICCMRKPTRLSNWLADWALSVRELWVTSTYSISISSSCGNNPLMPSVNMWGQSARRHRSMLNRLLSLMETTTI